VFDGLYAKLKLFSEQLLLDCFSLLFLQLYNSCLKVLAIHYPFYYKKERGFSLLELG